jgi:hypothetical protein
VEQASALLGVLRAAAVAGAEGEVRVVGFGEDHGFSIALRGGKAKLALLSEDAIAELQPVLAALAQATKETKRARGARAKAASPRPVQASTPLEQARALVGEAPFRELSSREPEQLGVFRALGEERRRDAIPWLVALLDHPTDQVRHAAADALLYYDEGAALEPLIARLSDTRFGGHGVAAVSALFKLRPATAFDELAGVRERVTRSPRARDLVVQNVLGYLLEAMSDEGAADAAHAFARHGLPRDVLARDPRWLDQAVAWAGLRGDGLAFEPLRLLVRARDPRRFQAFVDAARSLPIDTVVSHLRFLGDPAAAPVLRAAGGDETHPHRAVLTALGAELGRRKKAAKVPY